MRAVYKIESLKTGKIYIGSSTKLFKRWNNHTKKLYLGTHENKDLQNLVDENGLSDLRFSVVEVVPLNEDLLDREAFYSSDKTLNRIPRYKEGNVGFKHKRETVLRILKSNNLYRPIIVIDKEGNILGKYDMLKDASEATGHSASGIRDCIREKRYCKKGIGFINVDDYKPGIKLRDANDHSKSQGIPNVNARKPVYISNIYGENIKYYSSIIEAAANYGVYRENLRNKINKVPQKMLGTQPLGRILAFNDPSFITPIINYWQSIRNLPKGGNLYLIDLENREFGPYSEKVLIDFFNIKNKKSLTNCINRDIYFKSFKVTRKDIV